MRGDDVSLCGDDVGWVGKVDNEKKVEPDELENEPLPRTCRAQARDDYVDDCIDHPREHLAVIRPTVGGVRFGAHPGYLARESGGVTVTGQLYQPATESCSRRAGGVAACVRFHTWGVPDPGHCDTQPGPRRAPIPPTGVDGPESVSAAATGPAVSAGVVRRHYPLSPARPPARSHPSPAAGAAGRGLTADQPSGFGATTKS